jgi:hypothetical protein
MVWNLELKKINLDWLFGCGALVTKIFPNSRHNFLVNFTLWLHVFSVRNFPTPPSADDRITVMSQVFKNPDCAVCNGVAPLNTTCWSKLTLRRTPTMGGPVLPFSIVLDFMDWEDKSQQYRWDVAETATCSAAHYLLAWRSLSFEKSWQAI